MDINQLLKGVDCSCGKRHECNIEYVYVEKNALRHLEALCKGYKNILIVADENTYGVAGQKSEKYLEGKNITRIIFSGKTVLIPDERAIDAVNQKLDGIDLILAIGSGVIQDLCKYVSFNSGIPYYVVATAPSMDGYASSGAAMITSGMKVTYSAKVPNAIIADSDVLATAPIEMIKAGYGDIIGKYSALNDWKLGTIVNGEYFCKYIYDLTFDMVKQVEPLAKKLLERDADSVEMLMKALVIVGVAMSFATNSRPASGSEHHLSHFFEITGIVDNTEYLPHGIDVVFSTVITSKIRQKLINTEFDGVQFEMDCDKYKAEISRVYKTVADECIALQAKLGTYSQQRAAIYAKHQDEIKEILKEVPTAEQIESILKEIDLDINDFYKVYSNKKLSDAVHYAKDLKDRYTVLWMYYDICGIEEL